MLEIFGDADDSEIKLQKLVNQNGKTKMTDMKFNKTKLSGVKSAFKDFWSFTGKNLDNIFRSKQFLRG